MITPVPYDLIADQWSCARRASEFGEKRYLDRFLELVEPSGHVLDLGCGSGVPIARYLLDRSYRLTGVDSSSEMLRLARTHCPEAVFVAGDMASIELADRYHGIVAWDSIFVSLRFDSATSLT